MNRPGPRANRNSSRHKLLFRIDSISNWLKAAVIVLLLLMLLSQIAMQNDIIRHALTGVEKWEGTFYP